MILIINTSTKDCFELLLAKKKNEFKAVKVKGSFNQAEKLLPEIDKLLKKEKVKKEKLTGIGVVTGPGGFTSIRIGVAVANVFGFALSLPIIGVKASEFEDNKQLAELVFSKARTTAKAKLVLPFYDREPNITMAKK
jgi:tRNA threonylcarbamoyladenosine biosynthesis protein TsaB